MPAGAGWRSASPRRWALSLLLPSRTRAVGAALLAACLAAAASLHLWLGQRPRFLSWSTCLRWPWRRARPRPPGEGPTAPEPRLLLGRGPTLATMPEATWWAALQGARRRFVALPPLERAVRRATVLRLIATGRSAERFGEDGSALT